MHPSPAPPRPTPNWYPDPEGADAWRWWDGKRWTDHVHVTGPPKPDASLPGPNTVGARMIATHESLGERPAPRLNVSALWPALAEAPTEPPATEPSEPVEPSFAFVARTVDPAPVAEPPAAPVVEAVEAPAAPAAEPVAPAVEAPVVEAPPTAPAADAPPPPAATEERPPAGKPRRRLLIAAPVLAAAAVTGALVLGGGSDPAPSPAPSKGGKPAPKTGLEGLVVTTPRNAEKVRAQLDAAFTRAVAKGTGPGFQHTVDCYRLLPNEYSCSAASIRGEDAESVRTEVVYVTVDPRTGRLRPRRELSATG